MKRIFYLGRFEIGKSETDSGILYPAKKLAEKFGDFQFLMTVVHNTKQDSIDSWKRRIPCIEFIKLPSPEKVPKGTKTFYLRLLTYILFKPIIKKYQPTHIYIRDCNFYGVAKRLAKYSKAKVIFKVAGAIIPEAIMRDGRISLKTKWLNRFIFSPAIRHADVITAVSWRFKSYLEESYFRQDTIVIPSTVVMSSQVKKDNLALREKLGFSKNDFVLCYSGGASIWQRCADMFRFFKLLNEIELRVKLLILSYNVAEFNRIAIDEKIAMKHIAICQVPRDEVDTYYAIADAGICLRHNNIVNNVASPFKIGEYWQAGLPVIMTRGIGDYSYEAIENGLGIVLADNFLKDRESVLRTIHYLRTMNRTEIFQRCRNWAEQNISIESQLDKLIQIYQ